MPARLLHRLIMRARAVAHRLQHWLAAATRLAASPVAAGVVTALARTRSALVAENAFLRHQLALLQRRSKRPRCTPTDRALLVLLASRARGWRPNLAT